MPLNYDPTKTGYVHSTYSGGMVDGPGIRYVIFFAGCTLRCKYCHNPDTWVASRGTRMSVEELINEIVKYKNHYVRSGGGVTISGGEPMEQPGFLAELLKACREHGIHTALDTSGNVPISTAERIFPLVDLLMFDVKSCTPDTYLHVTGKKIEPTLNALDVAQRLNVRLWARFVLVPGLTDKVDEIHEMAAVLRKYDNIEKIEVLPFHKAGEYKWDSLVIPYELTNTPPPTLEQVEEVQRILTFKN
ncbi:MAG: pyruvate formate-lyase-activating protein [Defluviitaleaceae bacterium]|nr:pyruvate formate-lyase-activating protein [Defluviitaleaceae bacterium]